MLKMELTKSTSKGYHIIDNAEGLPKIPETDSAEPLVLHTSEEYEKEGREMIKIGGTVGGVIKSTEEK